HAAFPVPGRCYDETALRAIAPTGVTVIQYDLASGDAFGTSTQAIVTNVLTNTKNGSIIVMHITDGNTAPLTRPRPARDDRRTPQPRVSTREALPAAALTRRCSARFARAAQGCNVRVART